MKLHIRVPATTANLGPGFDCLGLALDWWNTIDIETIQHGLQIECRGTLTVDLPRNKDNLVILGMSTIFKHVGKKLPPLRVEMDYNIPIGSGLGSSSAAIVGGMVAANKLLDDTLSRDELVTIATRLEGHPDNVAPALLGGLVVAAIEGKQVTVARFPVPRELRCVLFIPETVLLTKRSRGVLPQQIARADAIYNASRVALWIAALRERHWDWLDAATQDRLHQPYRAKLVPGMYELFDAARSAGAKGVALSGAGPSIIAFTNHDAAGIADALLTTARQLGISGSTRIMRVSGKGVQSRRIS